MGFGLSWWLERMDSLGVACFHPEEMEQMRIVALVVENTVALLVQGRICLTLADPCFTCRFFNIIRPEPFCIFALVSNRNNLPPPSAAKSAPSILACRSMALN